MSGLRMEVLGPIQGRRAERALPVRATRLRMLVAALLVDGPRVVPTATLMDRLYDGAAPASGVATLHVFVNRLRQLLEPDRRPPHEWTSVLREDDGYRFGLGATDVDRWRYEQLVREATATLAHDPAEALRTLDVAAPLWRGVPWAGLVGHDWLDSDITALADIRSRATELEAEALLDTHQHDRALTILRGATLEEPFREHRWALLMTALYRSGRQEAALQSFDEVRSMLIDELGVEPGPELQRLRGAILDHDESLRPPAATASVSRRTNHNIPHPVTRLVGRDAERELIRQALGRSRLVTLTGPGGTGKTRLAIDGALAAVPDFADGVWFVDLDRSGHRPVASEVADVLPFAGDPDDLDLLIAHLSDRRILLVLDNCEHVIDDVATTVARVLSGVPTATVLATSRLVLDLHGETQISIPPLALPHSGDPVDVAASPAVQLFMERSASVQPLDAADAETMRLVTALVERLDGLPLAIELAASKLRSLGLAQLVEGMGDRVALLASDHRERPLRQRALRASLDISHELLVESDRRCVRRLSLLPAGFTIELLTDGYGMDVTEAIALADRLVAASLAGSVDATGTAPLVFRFLETTREDAHRRLIDSGEGPAARVEAMAALTRFAEAARDRLTGAGQRFTLDALDALYPNFINALEWASRAGQVGDARRLAVALDRYWFLRHHWGDGVRWLNAVDHPDLETDDPLAHARLVLAKVVGSRSQDNMLLDRRAALELSGRVLLEHGAVLDHLEAVGLRVIAAGLAGDLATVDELARHSEPLIAFHGSEWHRLTYRALLAMSRCFRQDFAAGAAELRDARDAMAQHGDLAFASRLSLYAAMTAHVAGDVQRAREDLIISLDLSERVGGGGVYTDALLLLSEWMGHEDDAARSAHLRDTYERAVSCGERVSAARCRRDLGELDLRAGNVAAAGDHYRQALPALAELNHADFGIALVQLARECVDGMPSEAHDALLDGAEALWAIAPFAAFVESRRLFDELQAAGRAPDAASAPEPDVGELVTLALEVLDRAVVNHRSQA